MEAMSLQRRQGWSLALDGESSAAPADATVSYASRVVEGIQEHSADIDRLISDSADRWALDRMAVVDKNILRLAVFELFWIEDVPAAVVINEAVELAKCFSTEDSGRFINGILGRLVEEGSSREPE